MRIILGILAVIAIVLLAVWAIDVDVSGDVEMPTVEVTGGEMPDVDVDTVDVDATMEEKTILVPNIDVTAPEENTTAEDSMMEDDSMTEEEPVMEDDNMEMSQ